MMPRFTGEKYCDSPKTLGNRLRRMRELAGVSQRRLSFPGCTAAYISRIERGDRTPSLQMLHQLAHSLGFPPSVLAWGWRPPFDTQERAMWITEVFGSATDYELRQIKLYNPPKTMHKRLPWLSQKLLVRGRPVLAANAKKVYDLRFRGGRR